MLIARNGELTAQLQTQTQQRLNAVAAFQEQQEILTLQEGEAQDLHPSSGHAFRPKRCLRAAD